MLKMISDDPSLNKLSCVTELLSHPRFVPRSAAGPESLKSLIGAYDSGLWVKCGFGHDHKNGYVVELKDGSVMLIGRQCKNRHFDQDEFARSKNLFEAKYKRERARELAAEVGQLRDSLQAYSWASELARRLQRFKDRVPPQVVRTLSDMGRKGTDRIEIVRKSTKQEREVESLFGRPSETYFREVRGTLDGVAALQSKYDVKSLLHDAEIKLRAFSEADIESTSTRKLNQLISGIASVKANLPVLKEAQTQLVALLSVENLEKLTVLVDGSGNKKRVVYAARHYGIHNDDIAA